MEIRRLESDDREMLARFLERVPQGDRTFFKEDVDDRDVVEAWLRPGPARAIAVEDGQVVGSLAVVPLHGWSSHVGEVRLIVDPARRGRGIGRALARRAVVEALELGLEKMVVEVIARQEPTVARLRPRGALDQPRARPGGEPPGPPAPLPLGAGAVVVDDQGRDRR
jgi:GNAT superfamily N-acetyltransferase